MIKRTNYNSVIFLTTLSVYLGLVLVGAPAPVLSQAILTGRVEVKDKIEKKDELDNKPDDYDGLDKDIEVVEQLDVVKALLSFVSDIKSLESIGKIEYQEDLVFSYKVSSKEFGSVGESTENTDISNSWLKAAIGDFTSETPPLFSFISDDVPNCDGENNSCKESSIEIKSTSNEFSLTYRFNKSNSEKAKIAADRFNAVFTEKKIALRNTKNLEIYENTKATAENNQVFIVTRLPRGSLDALLARKSAK